MSIRRSMHPFGRLEKTTSIPAIASSDSNCFSTLWALRGSGPFDLGPQLTNRACDLWRPATRKRDVLMVTIVFVVLVLITTLGVQIEPWFATLAGRITTAAT